MKKTLYFESLERRDAACALVVDGAIVENNAPEIRRVRLTQDRDAGTRAALVSLSDFDAGYNCDGIPYSIDWGDGVVIQRTSDDHTPAHIYDEPGIYTVVVTAWDRIDPRLSNQVIVEENVQFERAPGDATADWIFDSHDLVIVFQAGKYETGQPARWTEGDWNHDDVFDTSDLVLAFQAGAYFNG